MEDVGSSPELKRPAEVIHLAEAGTVAEGTPGGLPHLLPVLGWAAQAGPVGVQVVQQIDKLWHAQSDQCGSGAAEIIDCIDPIRPITGFIKKRQLGSQLATSLPVALS